jgi:membrane protease subunit (stomatin/prohibitin family)
MCINDALGELKRDKKMAVVDMPAYLQEIEQIILSKVEDGAGRYGIKITKIADLNINLPKEVQEAIDKRGAMGALGVNYMQYQTGKAIEGVGIGAATGAGGGGTGAMAGLGAGAGVGLGIGTAMGQAMQQPAPAQQAPKPTVKCSKCNADVQEGVKFCPNCGSKITMPGMMSCPKCNAEIKLGSKFCASCGEKLVNNCPKCNAELQPGAKFCPSCGNKIE